MATESERVVQMKQSFMELHQQGLTIPQIADKFNLSRSTAYRQLESIARANNVPRDYLLQEVHQTPSKWLRDTQALKVDGEQLLEKFNSAQNIMSEILSDVQTLIDVIEEELSL